MSDPKIPSCSANGMQPPCVVMSTHVGDPRLEPETDEELAKISGLPVDVIARWPRNEQGMMLNAWVDTKSNTWYGGNPAAGPVGALRMPRTDSTGIDWDRYR